MPRISPCKDCQDRTTGDRSTGCHATCERYAEYVAMLEARNKARRMYNQVCGAEITGRLRVRDVAPTGGNKRH